MARVFAIFYAAFSPFIAISMLLSGADYLRIPLGLVAPPLTYLNINFNIQRPEHFISGALFMLFGVVCYAATGCLTGAVAVLCFNFIARQTGGSPRNRTNPPSNWRESGFREVRRDPSFWKVAPQFAFPRALT